MSFWWRLFGSGAARQANASTTRWVVVDVESSGLDMQHDRLLAIAAVALGIDGERTPRIEIADSFEAVLQQQRASVNKGNILLHGIGVGEQRAGTPAADALAAFERWLADAPLLAFHAEFDKRMIERAMKAALGRMLPNPWLDLEPVADALHPEVGGHALDDWLAHFNIECAVRHQAAADTLATAELLLRLWPAARKQGCAGFTALTDLAAQRRWLNRR
jgi:DNA polymerase III subunit epsilon